MLSQPSVILEHKALTVGREESACGQEFEDEILNHTALAVIIHTLLALRLFTAPINSHTK